MRPPRKFKAIPFEYHQEIELTIDTLTNEGSGLGRYPITTEEGQGSWVVFVPFTLPGERVKCRVYRNSKNFSEADLLEVLEASPHRREAQCSLFGQCGGCQYQNLDYAEQLRWKKRQVSELLLHMAKLEFAVDDVVPSPQQMGYRSKITPHFHKPKNGEVMEIGFLRAANRSVIVDVAQCPIAMPELNAALAEARETARAEPTRFKHGATLLLRASAGEVLTQSHQLTREEVGGVKFEFQAGDFFQNNPFILPAFVEHVVSEALASGARFLIDAYCGSGLFGLCAASRFEHISGVEVSESAVVKARHNAVLNGFTNCSFIAASAEQIFASIELPAGETVVIVDPPRAGCGEGFLQQLFAFGPKAIVYVSCNPPTQMRDLLLFTAAGYSLRRVQPFDLFPQTRHLECVMTLTK